MELCTRLMPSMPSSSTLACSQTSHSITIALPGPRLTLIDVMKTEMLTVTTLLPAPAAKQEPLIKVLPFVDIPASRLAVLCHPKVDAVINEVGGYFLQHWPFPDARRRKKFVNAGFSRVTCLYFPAALDDRIHLACRLLTVLFLIDGKVPIATISLAHVLTRPRRARIHVPR